MSNKTEVYSGGVGFFGLLAIVFIILKLINVITWGWLIVLSPLLAPLGIIIFVLIMLGLLYFNSKII